MKTDGGKSLGLTFVARDGEYPADTRPLDPRIFARLFKYSRPYALKRNILLALVLVRSAQLPVLAWMIGSAINGPIASGDLRGLVIRLAWYLAFALFTEITFSFRQRMALELGESVVRDLRRDLYKHLFELRMSFFGRTKLGRIISRFTSDAEAVRIGIQNVVFVSLVQLGSMTVAAALMLYYDRIMFLIVAAVAPILWLINRYFRLRLSRAYRDVQESFSRVSATVAESVRGVKVTQGFVRQDLNADMFRALAYDHSLYNVRVTQTESVFLPLMDFNSQLFIAALIVVGGYRALHPAIKMPIADLIQFFFLSGYFFGPIQSLANIYNQALTAMAGAERVFRFMDTRPEWNDPPERAVAPPDIRGAVEFRNVDFHYVPGRPVLHSVSFKAEAGETTALVGPTGCGKSTIINLIAKFYRPVSGEVLIDGVPTDRLAIHDIRSRMGIVLQQNFLFSGTVLDNILVGKAGAGESDAREAAAKLDCLDTIESLPDGLKTVVGERGAGLSHGQRQLICFTRAMLADPRILILDEATSSVDPITERRLQAALLKLLANRTSFVVAHRLSTIRHARQVLVVDEGRIVERGTHRQLLKLGGLYANLYRQFASSRRAVARR